MKPHYINANLKIIYNSDTQTYDVLKFHDNGWVHHNWVNIKSFNSLQEAIVWARDNINKIFH